LQADKSSRITSKKVLDRPAEVADIADFVCEYMNKDYMGQVAIQWLKSKQTYILILLYYSEGQS